MTMKSHAGLATGEVSRVLGVPEHRLTNLVRFQIIGAPPIVGGRRAWRPEDVEAARRALVERGVIATSVQP